MSGFRISAAATRWNNKHFSNLSAFLRFSTTDKQMANNRTNKQTSSARRKIEPERQRSTRESPFGNFIFAFSQVFGMKRVPLAVDGDRRIMEKKGRGMRRNARENRREIEHAKNGYECIEHDKKLSIWRLMAVGRRTRPNGYCNSEDTHGIRCCVRFESLSAFNELYHLIAELGKTAADSMSRCYVVLPSRDTYRASCFSAASVWLSIDAATSNTVEAMSKNSGLDHLKTDARIKNRTDAQTNEICKYECFCFLTNVSFRFVCNDDFVVSFFLFLNYFPAVS